MQLLFESLWETFLKGVSPYYPIRIHCILPAVRGFHSRDCHGDLHRPGERPLFLLYAGGRGGSPAIVCGSSSDPVRPGRAAGWHDARQGGHRRSRAGAAKDRGQKSRGGVGHLRDRRLLFFGFRGYRSFRPDGNGLRPAAPEPAQTLQHNEVCAVRESAPEFIDDDISLCREVIEFLFDG